MLGRRTGHWIALGLWLLQACTGPTPTHDPLGADLATANELAGAGERSAAAALYQDVLRRAPPDDPRSALALADLYLQWGRPSEGLAAVEEAAQRGASGDDVLSRRLALLTAAERWDEVLDLAAGHPDDRAMLGATLQAHLERGDCRAATVVAANILATHPNDVVAKRVHGLLSGDYRLLAAVAPDLGTSPEGCDAACENAIAQQLIRAGEWGLAHCVLLRVVAPGPAQPDAHAWLGEALDRLGQTGAARAHLREAVTLAPESPLAWLLLGRHYLVAGELHLARVGLLNAHRLDPGNPAPCLALAELKTSAGLYDEVDKWIDAALARAPASVDVWKSAARFYLTRNLSTAERQLAIARHATELAPDDAEAHLLLGWSWLHAGDPQQALAALDEALSLAPTLAEAHHLRAVTLEALGDVEAARAARIRAADLGIPPSGTTITTGQARPDAQQQIPAK